MPNASFVLKALRILSLDEMKKLSEIMKVRVPAPKKAAGGELIVWDEEEEIHEMPSAGPHESAKILAFPKKNINEIEPLKLTDPNAVGEDNSSLLHTDLVLLQKQISRQTEESIQRQEAFKGYKKSTEMYVVKESTIDGKDKIRFASTNGVLVNKKQA